MGQLWRLRQVSAGTLAWLEGPRRVAQRGLRGSGEMGVFSLGSTDIGPFPLLWGMIYLPASLSSVDQMSAAAPHSPVVTTRMSPVIAKYSPGAKSPPLLFPLLPQLARNIATGLWANPLPTGSPRLPAYPSPDTVAEHTSLSAHKPIFMAPAH